MKCNACGLTSETTLCQACQSAIEGTALQGAGGRCRHCGLPIELEAERPALCQICGTLLVTVCRRQWFIRAQADWEQENALLAKRKKELLGLKGPYAS
jgi:hypothetical protein